jgi:3-deoxy-D-manno-octulosonic-acid transferase
MRALYSAAMWALQPLLRRKLARRGRDEPGYLEAMGERFGRYDDAPSVQEKPPGGYVWVHAVSLGETRAAGVLLQALRSAMPDVRIVLTHGTATGRAQGKSLLREGDVQVWQPWDTPAVVRRFLQRFEPRVGIVLETEVWPNWVQACQRAKVPLVLVNARMSQKSLTQALRLAALSRPAYAGLTAVLAQTGEDAKRLKQLGAPVKAVLGNLKFDAQPDPYQLAQALVWKKRLTRPVVLLTSSREGEELMWLDALDALQSAPPEAKASAAVHWLVVPRHPQRFSEVEQLMSARGWQVSRRSDWSDEGPVPSESARTVWLGNSLGEMALYYGLADVALLGGSFAPLGGQNLIEATACGCPVVMGPHTFNFAEACELAQQAGAAIRVESMAQAVTTALQLVQAGTLENAHVAACLAFTQQHRGAAMRTVQALQPYLGA